MLFKRLKEKFSHEKENAAEEKGIPETVPVSDEHINELITLSKYISDLCVNEKLGDGLGSIYHHLPLKNSVNKQPCFEENWDLSPAIVAKVIENQSKLSEYAHDICNKYCLMEIGASMEEILPPWIVFPFYPAQTIGWRMGLGESYADVFTVFLRTLPDVKKVEYMNKYPTPEYMLAWY